MASPVWNLVLVASITGVRVAGLARCGLCRGLEAACRGADGEGRAVGGKIAVSGDIWFHFIRTA
ncbi:hypothetical protein BN890_39230 [Bacteroides xylanisolvens SD CC 1b]|uniref:Uncharacterized protein n=1 Tax=Bacteroides xylanisolvens SD CC 1b TaxID=702447 RepID=W6PQS5_9BACE|nr:hypothetical protein BN890_39230 [Bacteroides xylanisolvens SD CC 1b]